MNTKVLARAQRGVSMIEVLIAILVLAVGALGFAGVQVVAMQKSEDANYRSHAMLIAQDAVERMQANARCISAAHVDPDKQLTPDCTDYYAAGVLPKPKEGSSPPDPECEGQACNINTIIQNDLEQLAYMANRSLPDGEMMIAGCPFNGLVCVALGWGGTGASECVTDNGINLDNDGGCLVMEFSR